MKSRLIIALFFFSFLYNSGLAQEKKSTYVAELKELSALKVQGKITDKEYETRKGLLKETFLVSQEKKDTLARIENENKIKAEKDKQAAVAKETLAYKANFPLHAALKDKDNKAAEDILKASPNEITKKDSSGKTAWDIAYEAENFEVLPKMVETYSSIPASAEVKIQVGMNYKLGGFQAAVAQKFKLLKIISCIDDKTTSQIKTMSAGASYITPQSDEYLVRAFIGNMTDFIKFLNLQPDIQTVETDSEGRAIFKNIPPGEYAIMGVAPTRMGVALWYHKIQVANKNIDILLDSGKAAIAF